MSGRMKRVVVKVGTRTLTSGDNRLDRNNIRAIVRQLCSLADTGTRPVLVTSGAIAAGCGLLALKKRPHALASLQAVAAIGQSHLMDLYRECFDAGGYVTGQMLLTQEDFNDRARYLNIKLTLRELLRHRAIPVINENDTVSTAEIRCGDNDRLSGLVADLAEADLLIILTDVDGLLDEEGRLVEEVGAVDERVMKFVRRHAQGGVSMGGMVTKLDAARHAAAAGIDCVIANGRAPDVIVRVLKGERVGTFFKAGKSSRVAKGRWLAFSVKPKGAIVVDGGAREVLIGMNRSLLPSGITGVRGSFRAKETVSIVGGDGVEFARGIANYSSQEIEKIRGLKTGEIRAALGHKTKDEVVHKDDLVVLRERFV